MSHVGERGAAEALGTRRALLIDGVRGLACVLVVWSHTVVKSGWFYEYVFDPGKIGVIIFFFISGYLVVSSAVRKGSIRGFLVNRLLRLYPLYWISIGVALVLWPSRISVQAWFANLTMGQQLLGMPNGISVYWTLTIEFCLYVAVCLFLWLLPSLLTTRLVWVVVLFGCVALASGFARWLLEVKIPVAIPLGLFCMFVGAWVRSAPTVTAGARNASPLYVAFIIPTCWLAYSFNAEFDETASRYVVSYLVGGAAFLLMVWNVNRDPGRLMTRLGDASYGIYLFHFPVIFLIEDYLGPGLARFAVVLVLTTAVSLVLHELVEKPAIRLGKRLAAS